MEEIFSEVPENVQTIDEHKNYLEELVGDGKKFKTPEDLAKGKFLADQTVEVLKAKLDEMKKELNTRMSLESFKTELEALRQPREEAPPAVTPDANPILDDSKLESMLEALLSKKEAQRRAETNKEKVTRVLSEQFGEQANLVINRKAQEVGMTVPELRDLAYRSPSAFFRLVGVTETERNPDRPLIPQSSVHPDNQSSPVHGRKYYEELKRTNPKVYFNEKTTIQMMKDMAALGKARFEQS